MARNDNGNAQRKPAIPLTLVNDPTDTGDDDDVYIVYGEAGEDLAFEICEDLELALEVRDSMLEDGFKVRLFQSNEVEVVTDDEPTSGTGGQVA